MRIQECYRETWSIVYVTQESFDYLLKKGLVKPANRWQMQVKLPDAKYLGYNDVMLHAYALASDEFMEKRLNLEKSLADEIERVEKLQELINHPEPLYRLQKYIPHTDKTFRESGVNVKIKNIVREKFSILRTGLRIHVGSAEVTYTWEELFTTATTSNGQPFGQLVSDVINKAPTDPTPTDPTEPDFL